MWSPIGNVPCAFSCLPPPAPGLSPTPLQAPPPHVHSGLQMTHPLLSRELKYVIQRFAEDPRQEVSLFCFTFSYRRKKSLVASQVSLQRPACHWILHTNFAGSWPCVQTPCVESPRCGLGLSLWLARGWQAVSPRHIGDSLTVLAVCLWVSDR